MPRATCRCGHELTVPGTSSVRVVCPRCGARVRIRIRPPADGFLRFLCPCGRRLKVSAANPPPTGQCPDCGRTVPVPREQPGRKPVGHPETPTVDLGPDELAQLDRWARRHAVRAGNAEQEPTPPAVAVVTGAAVTSNRAEAGLRVCPKCKLPVHLGSDTCRACGTPVPRR